MAKRKQKRTVSSRFLYLIVLLAAGLFFYSFYSMPMFPKKWSVYLLGALIVLMAVVGFFTTKLSYRNIFQKFINILLSAVLCIGAVLMPYYTTRISDLFNSATGNIVKINLYAMSDAYKDAREDLFVYTIDLPKSFSNVDMEDYADAVYGTMVNVDPQNQSYALNELVNLCGGDVVTVNAETLEDAVENLYNNVTDILVMSQSYISMIEDIEGYESFSDDTVILYTIRRTIETEILSGSEDLTTKPFVVFFGGNDQTGELSLEGRTDVDMLVVVNPNSHQVAIINMPRDSYIPNPAYGGAEDKLTHLGMEGLDNTLEGLGDYLDVDIENYVLVNFDTFMAIIDAINGIDLYNPYEFTAIDGQHFDEGNIHMLSEQALMYVRERDNLPDGDFGRNMHQQLVMEAIINKITSAEGIVHFNDILDNLSGYFLTNITGDSLYALVQKQLNENISWNIVKYHVLGELGLEYCASYNYTPLSVVYPYPNQIEFVKTVIDDVIAGNQVTQEELPDGSYGDEEVQYNEYYEYEESYDIEGEEY